MVHRINHGVDCRRVLHAKASLRPTAAPGCAARKRFHPLHFVLAYRTQPATIAVGKHFAVEFVICPVAGAPAPQRDLLWMPSCPSMATA